tara:strand:+ start:1246 stop:1821 length:576 start_codon:yes stop_codon:yes gene_type:complete
MNRHSARKWLLLTIILFLPFSVYASVPAWKILPSESSIKFTGVQNSAPASGTFKKFNGTIHFDPNQLNSSNVDIVIDMNSVSMSYGDFTTALLTEDWFNVKLFPDAVFKASKFIKTGDNKYQADGTLTIRDKTVPIQIIFNTKELSSDKVIVTGNTILKRIQFGVGQGEWADTDAIKDDVKVIFSVTAQRI